MKVMMIMLCRGADESTGYKCACCGRDLHVTSAGIEKIKQHDLRILCNPCGLECSQLLERLGVSQGVALNPEAARKLKEGQKGPVADWVRTHYKEDN